MLTAADTQRGKRQRIHRGILLMSALLQEDGDMELAGLGAKTGGTMAMSEIKGKPIGTV